MSFNNYANEILAILQSEIQRNEAQETSLQLAEWINNISKSNKLTTIFGNGGSAADAQHWAAELSGTYHDRSRMPFKAIALTTDTSVITALANDFDFSSIFEKQIKALGFSNGLSIGLSTSGTSSNVLKGLDCAKKFGAKTVLISGSSTPLIPKLDMHLRLKCRNTASIQTITQIFYHSVCNNLEP